MPHHALTVPPPEVPVPIERQVKAVERALCLEDGRLRRELRLEKIHPTQAAIIRAELRAALQTLRGHLPAANQSESA